MRVTKKQQKKVKNFMKGFDFIDRPDFEMSVEDSVREIVWNLVTSSEAFEFIKVRLKDYDTPDFENCDIFECIQVVVNDFKGDGVIIPEEEK